MTQLDTGRVASDEAPRPARLTRSRSDKMIAGVCGGLGRYFGVDPVWFRIAFVVLAFGGGSGVLIYAAAWLVMPEFKGEEPPAATTDVVFARGPVVAGLVLMSVGIMLFFNNLVPWFDEVMWPLLLVAAGIGLLIGVRRDDNAR